MKKTPLNAAEHELGGKMIDFGGWEMPVQFSGILDEHQAVRTRAGLFDVSHMGEILVKGPDAETLLQRSTCNDVSKLEDGRAQYNGLLYPTAGFVDDILIYRMSGDDYFVVVNAANTDKDYEWLLECAKGMDVEVRNVSADYAQLALQGPQAERLLQPMTDVALGGMKYYHFGSGNVDGVPAIVSRTGYTGEDGFEIYVAPSEGPRIMRKLIDAGAKPCGLGARDTLRLEARWRSTATTSTRPPRRSKRTSDGSSKSTRATFSDATSCSAKRRKGRGGSWPDSRWSTGES